MELQQYAQLAKRYWRSMVAIVLLCIAAAGGLTLILRPSYTSHSSIFVSVDSGASGGDLYQGASYAEQQVTSFSKLANSELVLKPVIARLGLATSPGALAKHIVVTSPTSTSIIDIAATDNNPHQAAAIADTVAQSLVSAVSKLSPTSPTGTQLVTATIVNTATVSATPTSPKPLTNLVLGLVLGVVIAAGQALVRSAIDTRIKTTDDLARVLDAPLLAAVGHVGLMDESDSYATGDPNTEAYRRLRTNVGFLTPGTEHRRSLVVTSPNQSEGKTQTIIGLARMLAQAGERVLLIDADMRRPTLAQRLRLDPEPGLSQVLAGRGRIDDFVIQVDDGTLFVLPAGSLPPNPAELLASRTMENLLATAEAMYDYVLIDSPPVLPVTDSVVIAERVSGVILVIRSGRTRVQDVREAARLLETAGVTISGAVVNDVARSSRYGYGGYGSAYYSSSQPGSARSGGRGPSGRRGTLPSTAMPSARVSEADPEMAPLN